MGLIVLAGIAVIFLKVSFGILVFAGALLVCPLLHAVLMKGRGRK